ILHLSLDTTLCTLPRSTLFPYTTLFRSALAPLHNPLNVQGIELCRELFAGIPQIAVFDTSFHQSIPEAAYLYGVPYDWYEQDAVRRYGFHGDRKSVV